MSESNLASRLSSARKMEEAAELWLRAIGEDLRAHLEQGPAPLNRAQVQRVMLRRAELGGDQRILHHELGSATTPELQVSNTAWLWVNELSVPVILETFSGEIRAPHAPNARLQGVPEQLSDHTRASLKNRQCTHALALPVLNEQGELLGMVVVELRGLYLVGLPLEVWDAALRCVEELVRLGGPHVLREWPEEGVEDLIDAQMPVVGRRMAPLLRTLLSFIDYPEPILLEGETGVGKTHLARWVHRRSLRHGGPFEVVALQDLPENLIEAELFGWRRGAFTGATHDQAGAVSRASGGTLFLDDVQCLPLSVQYKLLRLVGERRWRPLGDSGPEREADLRILVGSNLDLSDLVRGGKFRMDLFYRLNGLRVKLPPLRARKDELLPLLRSFGAQARRQDGSRGPVELARGAERLLETATWSGNLRQLRSVVLRAVASVRPPAELGTTLTLREADLRWSLSMEPDLSDLSGGWQTSLEQAARDWAREALDRYEQDKPPLRLEQTEVFSAMVLRELVSRTETVSEAFRVLGEADLVRNRNQFRKWEEAQARIARFKGQGRPKE